MTEQMVLAEKQELTRKPDMMDLLQLAISNNSAIDVIERLASLQKDLQHQAAEAEFQAALTMAQSEIKRIAPDLTNSQTHSQYASYPAIDRIIRPVYTQLGINLSFDTDDSPKPEHVRVLCYVSKGAYTRTYKVDIPADGKGAKGGDVMTKTHAAGSALSYGQRYLAKLIFNLAIGVDDDGNAAGGMALDSVNEKCEDMMQAVTLDGLKKLFQQYKQEAVEANDRNALECFVKAKDLRKKQLEAE